MSKAPASISQAAMTNGLKSRHCLFVQHDAVKEATDMAEYAVDFTTLPEQPKA